MSSHDALALHIRKAAGVPFQPFDCGVFMADWVRERIGVDPYAAYRGGVPVLDGRHVEPGTGQMVKMVTALARNLGLAETVNPQRGDVGAFTTDRVLAIGIHTGTGWVGKTPQGIFASRNAMTLIAYRVPHV